VVRATAITPSWPKRVRTDECAFLTMDGDGTMTVMTTLAEFARDPRKHIELVDGEIIVSPNAARQHFQIARRLTNILEGHGLIAGMEANLILIEESLHDKALVREPDVYVLREENDPDDDGLFQHAHNTLLVGEIVSPGSSATDWIDKMGEYAEAGIAHYWIVEFFGDGSPHLYTFKNRMGFYADREHWDKDVDIRVAGVDVRFDVRDLVRRPLG
jgi:Uma2 family endonuclease